MKKINYITLALVGLLVMSASCNRPMTYAERLQAEERAIAQFISENNFTILREFPSDTIFGENEFFRDPFTGVYFNIVCRGTLFNEDGEMFYITIDGNGDKVFNLFTEGELDRIDIGRSMLIRFRGLNHFMADDTTLHSNDDTAPIEMVFQGPVTRQTRFLYEGGIPGLVVPLQHIGHNGIVRLIIPFNMGSSWDRQNFHPAFFGEVNYRFERPWNR